jgi:hypothetical protein
MAGVVLWKNQGSDERATSLCELRLPFNVLPDF